MLINNVPESLKTRIKPAFWTSRETPASSVFWQTIGPSVKGTGVYLLWADHRDHQERPMYVGYSKNCRRRLREHFEKGYKGHPDGYPLLWPERGDWIACETIYEAQSLEANLIELLDPPCNRKGGIRFPKKVGA